MLSRKNLIAAGEKGFEQEILDCFCFNRLRESPEASPSAEPSYWSEPPIRFRNVDLAIRAVAAHAVLGRFRACLDYVRYVPDPHVSNRHGQPFSADDLLDAMINAYWGDIPVARGKAGTSGRTGCSGWSFAR